MILGNFRVNGVVSPREQSDDASPQLCGEWTIYDEAVTPTLLNRPPSWEETCFYCIHSSLWHFWWLFWSLLEGRKQRLKLSSLPNVFFYENDLLRNLKGFCVNWVIYREQHYLLYYIISLKKGKKKKKFYLIFFVCFSGPSDICIIRPEDGRNDLQLGRHTPIL